MKKLGGFCTPSALVLTCSACHAACKQDRQEDKEWHTKPHHKGKANLQEKHRHYKNKTVIHTLHYSIGSYTKHILPTLIVQNFTTNSKAWEGWQWFKEKTTSSCRILLLNTERRKTLHQSPAAATIILEKNPSISPFQHHSKESASLI